MKPIEHYLIVKEGINKNKKYQLLQDEISMGRDIKNTICIDDKRASGFHARIIKRRGDYYLVDAKSSNGTFLNNRQIIDEKLNVNDEIKIGKCVFIFSRGDENAVSPAEIADSEQAFIEKSRTGSKSEIIAAIGVGAVTETGLEVLPDNFEMLDTPYLSVLCRAGYVLHACSDLQELFQETLNLIFGLVTGDRACIILQDAKAGGRKIQLSMNKSGVTTEMRVPEDVAASVLGSGASTLNTGIISLKEGSHTKDISTEEFKCAICAPLKYKETILGIIYVESSLSTGSFTHQDLQFLTTLGLIAGVATHNLKYRDGVDKE